MIKAAKGVLILLCGLLLTSQASMAGSGSHGDFGVLNYGVMESLKEAYAKLSTGLADAPEVFYQQVGVSRIGVIRRINSFQTDLNENYESLVKKFKTDFGQILDGDGVTGEEITKAWGVILTRYFVTGTINQDEISDHQSAAADSFYYHIFEE